MTDYQGLQLHVPIITGINYLMRDDFMTPRSAGSINGTSAEPGPGTRSVSDASNVLLIDSTGLLFDNSTGSPYIYYGAISRAAGRCIKVRVNGTNASCQFRIGFDNASPAPNADGAAIQFASGGTFGILVSDGLHINTIPSWSANTWYEVAIVLQTTGVLYFIKGGAFTNWTFLWRQDTIPAATLYPDAITQNSNDAYVDYMRVYDLSVAFQGYNMATFTDTSLTTGDTFTGTADAVDDFEFTLNGSPSANDEVSLYYRGNDTDGWKAFLKRNAGNTAWDFRVRTVSGGVESTPSGWTDVTGVSTPAQIRVFCSGTSHQFYTRASGSGTFTKRGATLAVSHQDSATGMKIATASGTTLTRVTSYPYTGYPELDTT